MTTENARKIRIPLWEKIFIFIVSIISISSLYVVTFRHLKSLRNSSVNTTESPSEAEVRIVWRSEWDPEAPAMRDRANDSQPPPSYVVISHTATAVCRTRNECARHLRYIRSFHVESIGLADIAYSFMVGGNGLVYEGRGWAGRGALVPGFDRRSVAVSFVGNFTSARPAAAQLEAAKKLIELGVANATIRRDYKLLGHRQCSRTTLSPGDALYDIIKTWDHWAPEP